VTLPDLAAALDRRSALLAQLADERTDAFRVFHGAVEGVPGLTVDRYGPLVLAQSFHRPFEPGERDELGAAVRRLFGDRIVFVGSDRVRGPTAPPFEVTPVPTVDEVTATEFGLRYRIRARHRGLDPWLFLDLRAGRRRLRELVAGRSVLNLFAYTGSVGIVAAASGASEVMHVDFSGSNLAIAKSNLTANGLDDGRTTFVAEDCLAVLRQLAGLPVQRRTQRRRFVPMRKRTFDVVVLDPPPFAKGPFGTVDVVRDYPTLFKPAWLATAEGGVVVATNNVAAVTRDAFEQVLVRCAVKAGRPIRAIEFVAPDADFPSADGQHPLKIALCHA
jgi:23S rRNA (cytosine1962-C5)-methyltransferase